MATVAASLVPLAGARGGGIRTGYPFGSGVAVARADFLAAMFALAVAIACAAARRAAALPAAVLSLALERAALARDEADLATVLARKLAR